MILSIADLLNLMSFWCWDLVLGFWLTICFSISLGGGECGIDCSCCCCCCCNTTTWWGQPGAGRGWRWRRWRLRAQRSRSSAQPRAGLSRKYTLGVVFFQKIDVSFIFLEFLKNILQFLWFLLFLGQHNFILLQNWPKFKNYILTFPRNFLVFLCSFNKGAIFENYFEQFHCAKNRHSNYQDSSRWSCCPEGWKDNDFFQLCGCISIFDVCKNIPRKLT